MSDGTWPMAVCRCMCSSSFFAPYRHRCSNPAEQPEDRAAQPPSSTSAKNQVTEAFTQQLTQTPQGSSCRGCASNRWELGFGTCSKSCFAIDLNVLAIRDTRNSRAATETSVKVDDIEQQISAGECNTTWQIKKIIAV